MKTFREECSELAPLETFDPVAFRANAEVPQGLCNFVLTLALIYNDCKDLMYSYTVLVESQPDGPFRRTRQWGAWNGVKFHIIRMLVSLLHELFNLICDNQALLQHPFLVSVLKQLPKDARDAWKAVVAVASGATPTDPLGKTLLLIRNKVVFHYDPRAILKGYSHHFLAPDALDDRAFISRGGSMRETRFYFADAAATGYPKSEVGRDKWDGMLMKMVGVLEQVNRALMMVVHKYIQRRGCAYRAETE